MTATGPSAPGIMRAADSVGIGNSAAVARMLTPWQHTAEVHSGPEPLATLREDHDEDHGPVSGPRETR